jgi:hypothetical protein
MLNIQNFHLSSFDKFNFKLFSNEQQPIKICCLLYQGLQLQICFVHRPVTTYSIKVLTENTVVKSLQCQIFPSVNNYMGQNPMINSRTPDVSHSVHPATYKLTSHHQVLPLHHNKLELYEESCKYKINLLLINCVTFKNHKESCKYMINLLLINCVTLKNHISRKISKLNLKIWRLYSNEMLV